MSVVATVALVVIAVCQLVGVAISGAGAAARIIAARQMQKAMAQGRNVAAALEAASKGR